MSNLLLLVFSAAILLGIGFVLGQVYFSHRGLRKFYLFPYEKKEKMESNEDKNPSESIELENNSNNFNNSNIVSEGYTLSSDAEMQTRALIGDEAFDRMKITVENLLERHKADKSVTISLTSGCESQQASLKLHSLLPGDTLTLRKSVECGLELVDVYAAGFRIGRLLLGDADMAFDVMQNHILTGVYVAEQNCYGDCSGVDMKLILFYSPRVSFEREGEKDTPYKITVNGVKPIVIFQN